jgi:magnesium chelatase family protein
MWIPVEHIPYEKFNHMRTLSSETTADAYTRIVHARKLQHQRFAHQTHLNAHMTSRDVQKLPLRDSVRSLLIESARALSLSPRSYHRMIKLARTIADIEKSDDITEDHVLEALQYRSKL